MCESKQQQQTSKCQRQGQDQTYCDDVDDFLQIVYEMFPQSYSGYQTAVRFGKSLGNQV